MTCSRIKRTTCPFWLPFYSSLSKNYIFPPEKGRSYRGINKNLMADTHPADVVLMEWLLQLQRYCNDVNNFTALKFSFSAGKKLKSCHVFLFRGIYDQIKNLLRSTSQTSVEERFKLSSIFFGITHLETIKYFEFLFENLIFYKK